MQLDTKWMLLSWSLLPMNRYTMIAAHALSLGVTAATNNTREFVRVPGLTVVDWVNRRRSERLKSQILLRDVPCAP